MALVKKKKISAEEALEIERNRFDIMCIFEKEARAQGYCLIAGVDEAGRGPLAGPVVAAAVILPEDVFIPGLNDSKKLTPKKRDELYDIIIEKAISWAAGYADEKCIDDINILNATKRAMSDAINALKPTPDKVLIDAVKLTDIKLPQEAIIKGDAKSISIAAASIIAKVTRDRLLDAVDAQYPDYGFAKHKGYGTEEHINAIKKNGICPIHRISFTKNFTV